MRINKIKLFSIVLILFTQLVFSQSWMEVFNKENISESSIRKIFESNINLKEKLNYGGEKSILWYVVDHASYQLQLEDYLRMVDAIKLLITNYEISEEDSTILFAPIARSRYEIIEILLKNGISPVSWDKKKIQYNYVFTPIEEALYTGDDLVINLLQKYGAEMPEKRLADKIKFSGAVYRLDVNEMKKYFNSNINVNEVDKKGNISLLNIVTNELYFKESLECLKYLISVGADVNKIGSSFTTFGKQYTPLSALIVKSDPILKNNFKEKDTVLAMIYELIKNGAYVSGVDSDMMTPIHYSCLKNNYIVTKILLEAGAKVLSKNKEGLRPIDLAQSGEVIKLLKQYGAVE